jgi:cytochrome P450
LITQAGEQLVRQFTGGEYNLFRSLVQLDPPEHPKYRQITLKALAPQNIAALKGQIRGIAEEQLQRLREHDRAEIDWAKQIAMPYPLGVVLDLVGVPRADHPMMLRLTQWLFSWADPDLCRPGADPTNPVDQATTWKMVFDEFDVYFSALMAARQRQPQNDIASILANATIDGAPLDHVLAISYYAILATAGHDTTAHTTSNAMWVLAENPGLLKQLKAAPELIPAFVEEAIRWTTPVKHFVRHATADCELRGMRIRRGDRLYLAYPSANRDEEAFVAPFEFRLDRNPNRHVGFGFGGHVCLGQHLARLEMRTLWETLLPALEHVEMAGPGQVIQSEFVSGPKSVPIRFKLHAA